MKILKRTFLIILLLFVCSISVRTYTINNKQRTIKSDLIELSNIKYGLFNVDEWKLILADILTKKIEEFDFSNQNRKQMKLKVADLLKNLIGGMEERFYEQNENSVKGFFQNQVASFTNAFGRMRQDIPKFTEQIVDFLDDPKNKEAVRLYLIDQLNQHADKTFAKVDYSKRDLILQKYAPGNKKEIIAKLNTQVDDILKKANSNKLLLALAALLTVLYLFIVKNIKRLEFLAILAICLIFLIVGVSMPMIDIDARVSGIQMIIMGEKIQFLDQVLYYKSKSIAEVISLMISQGTLDLLIVGFLVLLFSILFPLSKIIASFSLLLNEQLKTNRIIHFLIHKTGKWSMADVMVVAIFMSYLGFSGILTEQLHQLDQMSVNLEVLTTNQSRLQTGFFAFTAFAIISLIASNKLRMRYNV